MSEEKKEEEKKPKKQGPIRTGAVVPLVTISTLIALYSFFLLDLNIEFAIEKGGGFAYGAQIDVEDVTTSFTAGTLSIQGIQITDIDRPERNLLEIGEIRMSFSWDALLRAKFVIPDAAIEEIKLHSSRTSPGTVYRTKKETADAVEGGLGSAAGEIAKNASQELQGNIFGDAANLLDGQDPTAQLGEVRGELKTEKKIAEIQARLKDRETYWNQRIQELPNKEKLDGHVAKIKALKFDIKKPKEFANAVQVGSAVIKEAESDIKTIKTDSAKINADVKSFQNVPAEIEQARKQDIAALQKRVSLPELDAKSLALLLFGDKVRSHIATFEKYQEMLNEYLPADEGGAEKKEELHTTRAEGKNYEFLTQKSYPLFWLQKAAISSTSDDSSLSGDIEGSIVDVTNNPTHLGRPTVAEIKGSFPQQGVLGLDATVTIDRREDPGIDTVKATIAQFPVDGRNFSDSESVKFGFKKAKGAARINGTKKASQLDMKIFNWLSQVDYTVQASSSEMQTALEQVAKDVPKITMNAHATGHWKTPDLKLETNLARAISRSLNRQLQAKVSQAKAKLRSLVDQKVSGQKAELDKNLNQFTGKYKGEIDKVKRQAESAKSQASAELNKNKKSGENSVKKKAEKEIKKLFKGLSF